MQAGLLSTFYILFLFLYSPGCLTLVGLKEVHFACWRGDRIPSLPICRVKGPIDLFLRGVKQQPCRVAGGTVNFYHTNNPQSQLP